MGGAASIFHAEEDNDKLESFVVDYHRNSVVPSEVAPIPEGCVIEDFEAALSRQGSTLSITASPRPMMTTGSGKEVIAHVKHSAKHKMHHIQQYSCTLCEKHFPTMTEYKNHIKYSKVHLIENLENNWRQ